VTKASRYISDLGGNAIRFKSFRDPSRVFAR
jgi:extradiol dioxygenase family protein